MINQNASLIPSEFISRAKKLGTAELCDAIKALELNIPNSGCMDSEINAVCDTMHVVGTALTIQTKDGDNFPIHLVCYQDNAEGYVLVVNGGGCRERAYAGDLIFAACKAVGYEGMIIDGLTRDKLGNISLGFPVWNLGFSPNSPIKMDSGHINTNIMCAGVRVCPGDLVVGDADGVCVVPREYILQVLKKAEEKKSYEEKRREIISAYVECKATKSPRPQLTPQWVLDLQSNNNL